MSQRIKQINELLRDEVSQLLLREIGFTEALVTITRVDTSADLRYAKVKISILPTDKGELVLKIIERNIFDMQQKLNKRLDMKPVPKLSFRIDQTEVEAKKIEEILEKIEKE